jgi:formate dehydrogenase major subunit
VDVPDFKADSPPKDHMGPFIMTAEGVGRIFAPLAAFADGPFPEHYEPFESPVQNALHPAQSNNPVVKKLSTPADKYGTPAKGSTSSAPLTGSPSITTIGRRTIRSTSN